MSTPGPLVAGLDPANLALLEWASVELWRIHQGRFGAVGFNDKDGYSSRFSPLHRPDGTIVPTLYGATSLDVALMETVFHDAPTPSAGFRLTLSRSGETRRGATIRAMHLRLLDFTTVGLTKLGLYRSDVIDSMKPAYPQTRALAEWAHANSSAAHGIVWTSRRDDSGQSVILFGDRLPAGSLSVVEENIPIVSGGVLAAIQLLATRLGALVFIDP